MNRFRNKSILFLIFALFGFWFFMSSAQAQDTNRISIEDSEGFQTAAEVYAYWTEERMQNAKPMPLLMVEMPAGADSKYAIEMEKSLQEVGQPGYAPGWSPDSGLPQPDPTVGYTFDMADSAPMTYGSFPTNPLNGPYPPFQRWTWYGYYCGQATATLGKLFFTIPGVGARVCTASVIGRRTIATAAQCMKSDLDNNGVPETWHQNWLFCPSYYKGSGSGSWHPTRGCWTWSSGQISNGWGAQKAIDRDYGCLVTQTTGTILNKRVGDVTGWTGRMWNRESKYLMFAWGYPVGPVWDWLNWPVGPYPFPGYHIITAVSVEWYEVNMTAGDGLVSKYIGNDMTSGAQGGPWWMSVKHKGANAEYNDTDGGAYPTDPPGCGTIDNPCVPGGPYLNGLNSHKRCLHDCWKPVATAGIFFQEFGSPQFRNTTADNDETEDIFAVCFAME